jgi:hypothetical protein
MFEVLGVFPNNHGKEIISKRTKGLELIKQMPLLTTTSYDSILAMIPFSRS